MDKNFFIKTKQKKREKCYSKPLFVQVINKAHFGGMVKTKGVMLYLKGDLIPSK